MQSVPREWLDFLRQQFPKDSRIQLTEIGGNPRPISPGSTGKLDYIDDAGQFHVKWDNGCTLALVLGEDRFSVYLPEPQTFKLYMPLTADFYGRDEWGDMSEDGEEWDGHTLMDYEGQILSALVKNRVPEENESGLMRWYGEDDSVDHKVRSAVFTVEVRNRQLWGVAECRVAGELTPEELTILKEYLGGQASDGWGEGFEQRPIEVDGGELYVHLWQPDDWSIQTEQERFAPKVAEGLSELCFSTLRTTGQLICIKRGETGYYPSDWDTGDKEGNVELADELNEDLGVTPIQRQATVPLNTTGQSLLSGNIFCGHCGGRLVLTTNGTTTRLADGTPVHKKRIRYVCYNKTRRRQECTGQTGYTMHILDGIVTEVLHQVFDKMQGASNDMIVGSAVQKQMAMIRSELQRARAENTKANKEYESLKAEVLKAIQGKSALPQDVLTEMLEDTRQKVLSTSERITTLTAELNDGNSKIEEMKAEFNRIVSWSKIFDESPMEVKKMICGYIIKKVSVFRDYRIKIEFNINVEQFLNGIDSIDECDTYELPMAQ